MTQPLWIPSEPRIQSSHLWRFIQEINTKYKKNFKTYEELYAWSLKESENFWESAWNFFNIQSKTSYKKICSSAENFYQTQWFCGATLSYAEHLLRRRDSHPAIIFRNEVGERRVLSYQELYEAVSRCSSALRSEGIQKGDRVVSILPNLPETVIAMLATNSIGAIWSSCSPDFGEEALLDRLGQIAPKILFTVDAQFFHSKKNDVLSKVGSLARRLPKLEKIVLLPYVEKNLSSTNAIFPSIILWDAFLEEGFVKNTVDAADQPRHVGRGSDAANQSQHVGCDFDVADKQRSVGNTIEFEALEFNDPSFILYSSGTTGLPKCITHAGGRVLLQHLKELLLHVDLKSDDVFFYYTTCGWMMWNWLVSGLAIGATLVLYDGSPSYPNDNTLFNLIDEEKISVFGTSAKFISRLEKVNLSPIKSHNLSSLKTLLSTGSPLLDENFSYIYRSIKKDLCVSSISGGTDIVSCFALGNPMLPVYSGELQCRGLGLAVEIFDEDGNALPIEKKGELVCTAPFPAMPVCFWNDPSFEKYHAAYFQKFPGVWAHGDYAELTQHGGMRIYGRSDAVLNPGGVRIGTAEIYRQVEHIPEIVESLAVGEAWRGDERIILFVKLKENIVLTEDLKQKIKKILREKASPRHVPAKIIQAPDFPRTLNGKLLELVVRDILKNYPIHNRHVIANPESLEFFEKLSNAN